MNQRAWNLNQSFDALLIPPDAELTKELVEQQFRTLVRAAHPDAGGDLEAAPERVKSLVAAKKQLLAYLEDAPSPSCFMCKGKGVVIVGPFGAIEPCSRCG